MSGREALCLEGVVEAGAPHPHLDLVHHDQDAVRPAALLQALEEAGGRDDDAAVGLDRLDEDGGDLVRIKLALEAPVQVIEGAGDQVGLELRAVRDRDRAAG